MEQLLKVEEVPGTVPMPEPLISVSDAARILGIAGSTIYDWCRAERLPHYRIGDTLRFRASELDAWLTRQRVGERA